MFVLGLEFSNSVDHCSEPELGKETWARFPVLTGKPRATWEVSELRCVWVPQLQIQFRSLATCLPNQNIVRANEIALAK